MNKCTCRDCIRRAVLSTSRDGEVSWASLAAAVTLCRKCSEAGCSPWPDKWYENDGEPFPMAVGYECQAPAASPFRLNHPGQTSRPKFSHVFTGQ
ncbi:hypothetical protein ACFWPU_00950 [Streptomyces sp. NPDC058471]|uniref:hypothetical protein n=1 Tax=Streptomyces sp. NPDC058471 TaxID=3346516 RepID=UPI0036571203